MYTAVNFGNTGADSESPLATNRWIVADQYRPAIDKLQERTIAQTDRQSES